MEMLILRGSSNIKFLVNGKSFKFFNIRHIISFKNDTDQIKSVEVITSPGVKI